MPYNLKTTYYSLLRKISLAPAFDLNPTMDRYQGIMISRDTNDSDLDAQLKAAEDYFIPKVEAEEVIKSIKGALKD